MKKNRTATRKLNRKPNRKLTRKPQPSNAFPSLAVLVKPITKWLATQFLVWLARVVFDILAAPYLKAHVMPLLIAFCGGITQALVPPSGLPITGSARPVISTIEIADIEMTGLRHFTVMARAPEPLSSVQ